jgi:hypothetical protein
MRKLAIMSLVAGAMLALPAMAYAQAGNITATATVNSLFSDGATQDLVFDAVNPGTAATVDVVTGAGGTPGFVAFEYNANYQVTATALPATLSNGASTLSVAWQCGTSADTGTNPSVSAACAEGGTVASSDTVTGMGEVVVWLGGTIADTNVLAGTYTGNITFTIAAF